MFVNLLLLLGGELEGEGAGLPAFTCSQNIPSHDA